MEKIRKKEKWIAARIEYVTRGTGNIVGLADDYGFKEGEIVHVTLSPVEDPERSRREPDYKAMWKRLFDELADAIEKAKGLGKLSDAESGGLEASELIHKKMREIEAKHTPQAGVKKEER